MKETYTDLIYLRRKVFAEVAKFAFDNRDLDELENLSYEILPGEVARYRDSIFKERAILEERIRLTMGLEIRKPLEYKRITAGMENLDMNKVHFDLPLVNVIPFACESCPGKGVMVTNNCRKCLAHPCMNVCPVNAIYSSDDGMKIDDDKCIRCGRCTQVCPYNAIVKYDRPCASVCGVNAIESDEYGRATINPDKCVSCGRCMNECPFGAISDKSQIYQISRSLARKEKNYAIIAPSFIGQFGMLSSPLQIVEAIKALGFTDVIEVSLGADITTVREAEEFLERVPDEIPFMATSCCNSWSLMVKNMFPEEYEFISDSSSPMLETGRYVKGLDPDSKVTFIGPCISKKIEAMRDDVSPYVDYVITYEELIGMFAAKNIDPNEMEVSSDIQFSSSLGRGFAAAGGVAEAVKQTAEKIDPNKDIKIASASNLFDCVKLMKVAKAGRYDGYLLEGMACPGGCIAGPGCMSSSPKLKKNLQDFMKEAQVYYPTENKNIKDQI